MTRAKYEFKQIAVKGGYRRVMVVIGRVSYPGGQIPISEIPRPVKIDSKTPIADEVAELLKYAPIRFPEILM